MLCPASLTRNTTEVLFQLLILFDPVAAVLLSGIVEDKLIYLHVVAAEIFFGESYESAGVVAVCVRDYPCRNRNVFGVGSLRAQGVHYSV